MINDELIDLLNRELDGELEPGELEHLQTCLAADAAARDYRAQLAAFSNVLAGMPAAVPPANLKPTILQKLEIEDTAAVMAPPKASVHWLPKLRQAWLTPTLSVAASLVVAVALLQLATSSLQPDDVEQAVGGIVAPIQSGESFIIDHPGLVATLHLQARQQDLLLQFTLDAEKATSTLIEVPSEHYRLLPFDAGIKTRASVDLQPGSLSLDSSGTTMVWALLRRSNNAAHSAEDVITVQFTQDGEVIHDASLPIPEY